VTDSKQKYIQKHLQKIFRSGEEKGRALKLNKDRRQAQVKKQYPKDAGHILDKFLAVIFPRNGLCFPLCASHHRTISLCILLVH
jgi:hypothetical protein